MRVLSLARVLFVFLAFQLAVGLQTGGAGVAHAAVPAAMGSHPTTASSNAKPGVAATLSRTAAGAGDACPMHSSSSQGSSHAKVPLNAPTDKHDCCKSSGCQCQCSNVTLAVNVLPNRNSLASALMRPVRAVRAAAAPAETHFRPPIVS